MKKEEVENILNSMQVPQPENIVQHRELKIPLLSYKRSSKAGLWLLLLPTIVAVMMVLKTLFAVQPAYISFVRRFFAAIDNNTVLTYLIPLIFIVLPLVAMVINLLAICHFQQNYKTKELIITIKYRTRNILVFLISFAVLVFFLLPDKLSFN